MIVIYGISVVKNYDNRYKITKYELRTDVYEITMIAN
jgi:hypothetical protein